MPPMTMHRPHLLINPPSLILVPQPNRLFQNSLLLIMMFVIGRLNMLNAPLSASLGVRPTGLRRSGPQGFGLFQAG